MIKIRLTKRSKWINSIFHAHYIIDRYCIIADYFDNIGSDKVLVKTFT